MELLVVAVLLLLAALAADGEHVALDGHLDVLLGIQAGHLGPQHVAAVLDEVLHPDERRQPHPLASLGSSEVQPLEHLGERVGRAGQLLAHRSFSCSGATLPHLHCPPVGDDTPGTDRWKAPGCEQPDAATTPARSGRAILPHGHHRRRRRRDGPPPRPVAGHARPARLLHLRLPGGDRAGARRDPSR
ncbi:hypothetical protein [Ornithinimicrobium kibberense]|uniref:hypothetical protein n=1 Tax=Ornithinimicrobium kibberense TaxID=282060 RepID=UPI003615E6F8